MVGLFLALFLATQPAACTGDDYNAACCYALAGNKDAAFAVLDKVVKNGWTNTSWMKKDPDLASLHDDARWNAIVAQADANWTKKFGNDNRELWTIVDADQEDREGTIDDVKKAIGRDHERLARVKEIVAAGGLKTSQDYFNAALVFQHGSTPDDYQKAHELAMKSAEIDPSNMRAKWLAAAAQDRYLRSIGKPQIYGTQFKLIDGVWKLEPIDESAVTDEDRAKWGVPPLAQQKRRAEEMNKKKP